MKAGTIVLLVLFIAKLHLRHPGFASFAVSVAAVFILVEGFFGKKAGGLREAR